MKKKGLAAMLAAIIASFTLAGCASFGNGSGTASSADADATSRTAEETTGEATGSEAGSGNAASDSSTDASGEPIELNFLYYADDTQKEILNAAIEDYENDHPGITITQTVIPADGSISTTIATMASSNTLPDVSYMAEADVVKYADAGLLMSLDDAINDGTIGKKLDAVTIHGSDGNIYGLGCSNQLMICYYNKDLFDAAGVDYPATDISGAWDWDTFISNAKKLTVDANGKHPDDSGFDADSVTQYGAAWSTMYQFYYMWALYSNGGGVVSSDGREFLWDQPESIEATQKIADLINVEHVVPSTTSSLVSNIGSADKALISGNVAMYFSGSWDLPNAAKAKEEASVNYGIGVLPMMKSPVTMNSGGPAVVYNTTQHPQEALDFYAYLLDPERVISILKTGAWLPNEESWYTDPDKIAEWTGGNVTDEAKDVILSYSTNDGAIAQWPVYYVPTWGDMMTISDSVMDSVWTGQATAADALGSVMDQLKAAFNGQ